ncbi:Response regulator MprA [compost metagenome]
MGLAIARRLAQLLGGQLVVDSEQDKGSCFALVLPLRSAVASALPAAMTAEQQRREPTPVRSATAMLIDWIPDDRHAIAAGESVILTIEDDPAFARILVDLIRRKGHRALAAADGESGLELARRYRPTGILLDVMLPGMDGWSVLQHLKHDPVTAAIPVHFISAVDEAAKGVALGAVGYLTKPVDRKALIAAFDHLLDVAGKIVRKLLLVDDDDDSRVALTHLLQADNVEIDQVASGEEALERIATHSYDCIVLDLNLGGISGVEFLERAATLVAVPPVVIYSGQDLSREESLKLRQYTDSIVIKGQRSPERLLDEVSLFLHSIGSRGAHATPLDDQHLAGRQVLLVDDDMRNLFALSKSLRARGVTVSMAQDGYKALQQLQENPGIELVLMDIMMPGMDGYETTREIRKRAEWSNLPIIAVTAKAMHGDRDKCLDAGANDYLTKPVDLDKLLSMMRVWLQK